MADERRYSKITYEQNVENLLQIFRAKQGSLADLAKSSYGRTLIELFSGVTDQNAFWIEQSFRDSFLETAENSGPIYAGARTLGYSVRRPVPARAGLGISLKRTGNKSTVKVIIPKNTQFSISGVNLLSVDDIEFMYDRNEPDFENGIMQLKSGRAIIVEGVFRNQQFFSDGRKFQEFNLVDSSLSDWFGTGDPNYIEPDNMEDRINRFTVVNTDAGLTDGVETLPGLEDKIFWRISRRGLQDPFLVNPILKDEEFLTSPNKTQNFTVLIETANDGTTRLSFGDGIKSAIPFGLVNIKYLSTRGENGNLLNVTGSKLTTNSADIVITQLNGQESDITLDDLYISLTTDIRGGLNIEEAESIKKNASAVFSVLDSLGNRNSYLLFLTRMFDIKYSSAFGEDLISNPSVNKFNIKYVNTVRYTLLGDIYREKSGNFFTTDPVEYMVPGYKVNGVLYTWEYDFTEFPQFGIPLIESPIKPTSETSGKPIPDTFAPSSIFNAHLRPEDFIETGSELDIINTALNKRGYLTLEGNHVYVPPTVHGMNMKMDLILLEGSVFSDIKTKIIQKTYKFLRDNTGFSTPLYRSAVESLIQTMPEIAGLNLKFVPRTNKFTGLKLDELLYLGPQTAQIISQDTSILKDVIDISFLFDYIDSDHVVSITLHNQIGNSISSGSVQNRIREYYITNLSKSVDGETVPREDVTEEDVVKYCSFIWATIMNEIFVALDEKYSQAKVSGDSAEQTKIFYLIEAIRGWFFKDGKVLFNDTASITNLVEGTTSSLFQYMTYTIEYIKLVRNIFDTIKSANLIDADGNVTNYSTKNEIVQFTLNASDITLKIGRQ